MDGELISSNYIGSRPLYGTYAIRGDKLLKEKISNWANENGIIISWYLQSSSIKNICYSLVHNGIGNAVITAFLLYLTTIVVWFVSRAKSRSIRLLGGVSKYNIHLKDVTTIVQITCLGIFSAFIVIIAYVLFTVGIKQIPLLILPSLKNIVCLLIIVSICGVLNSLLVKPKTEYLAERKIPLKRFRQLGTFTRVVSIILALLIIPSTIGSAYVLQQLAKEYSLWQNMQKNVSVSFGDIDSLATKKILPCVEKLLNDMETKEVLSLSLAIDKSILLNEDEYGGYDHIIITDKSWINTFEIGVESQKSGGKLNLINWMFLYKNFY